MAMRRMTPPAYPTYGFSDFYRIFNLIAAMRRMMPPDYPTYVVMVMYGAAYRTYAVEACEQNGLSDLRC